MKFDIVIIVTVVELAIFIYLMTRLEKSTQGGYNNIWCNKEKKKTILLKYIYIVDRNISFPNYLFYVYKNKFKKRRETTLKFLIKSSIFFWKFPGGY